MADEQKHGWWRSIPGLLTAGTGFLAALSGLLAGLNQIGAFDRLRAPASPPEIARIVDSGPASGMPVQLDTARVGAPAPVAPTPPVSTSSGSAASPQPASNAPSADSVRPGTSSRPVVLPSGTVLELAMREKVCSATSEAGDRVVANLVAPVAVKGGPTLPAGTKAVLRVQRPSAPAFLGMRLDSIVQGGSAVPVPKAEVRLRRETVKGKGGSPVGACVPAGGKIRATLRAPVRLQGA